MAELSDKAIGVFAFAAYHQLTSGQPVKSVVREDGKGHKADEGAVEELAGRQLVQANDQTIDFSESGLAVLQAAINGIKQAASKAV